MSDASGEFLDLTHASHQSIRWTGTISLATLPRLAAAISDGSGLVTADLLARYDGDQVIVQGKIEANLVLTCQRCFGNAELPVKADFTLAWVRSEAQAADLPDSYEPLLSVSGRVKIADIVEDELLLAMPMVALHNEPHACAAASDSKPENGERESTRVKPFAALKRLKRG